MARDVELDLVLIRSRKEKEIAKHILQLLREHRPIDVCYALLSAVDKESLDPQVFTIFLSATKSIDCILACLRQPYSLFVRRQAIKQYGKAFEDVDRWEGAWKSIGGAQGILRYLSEVSVWEVKLFFSTLGKSVHGQNKPAARSLAIEQLLKAMYAGLYPESKVKSPDKRPLEHYAIPLVPACSEDFIRSLIEKDRKSQLYAEASKKMLLTIHGQLILESTVDDVFNREKRQFPNDIHFYLNEFTSRDAPISSNEPNFSPSMVFSERLLRRRLENLDLPWPRQSSESAIYFNLLRRCRTKKIPKRRLHEILKLGMQLLAAKDKLKNGFASTDANFWPLIIEYWRRWPENWEDLYIRGLQLGLGGSPHNIPDAFLKAANGKGIKKERAWSILRLYCLHAIKDGIDIDHATDLKVLAKQRWSIQAFQKLPDEKIIHLLKLLLRANQNFDFLQAGSRDSILSQQTIYDKHNFNALLFLTQLQVRAVDKTERDQAETRATEMLEEFKKKAAVSREQSERAQYAKAAGFAAISSGSLEVFGAYVQWLQRFIRDPLTVKVVFNTSAIAVSEASTLLAAIPDVDYKQSLNLSDISETVAKANEILLKFHEHKQIAKREPSYQEHDWRGIQTLLHNSFKTRLERARKLQRSLDASQGELCSAIWSQTFAMWSQTGADSMREVQYQMQNVLTQLPPKTLATTTEAMLETDNRYRATKSTGKEAEDESRMIEVLAYQCLLALAKGDKPALAEELIVRTIIDRPDASSWHRQMLSISFFKALPAQNAENLLLGFAKAIGEKLEEQSYVRLGEPAGTPSVVKVTTVKYLAQLLQDAQFLSPDAAIDVLLELFKVATHPDIRFATLESMLSTLNTLCASELRGPISNISEIENPLIQKILAALDAVVPVVGSINERRPPRDQDWTDAGEDLNKLLDPSSIPVQPLWGALVAAARKSSSLKSYFAERLLLPIIEASTTEHRKYLSVFLKGHDASVSLQELPAVPWNPAMMTALLPDFITLLPEDLLDQINAYTKFLLGAPSALKTFVRRLKSDEDKRSKVDVQHFLYVFNRSRDDILRNSTYELISLIHHSWRDTSLTSENGIDLVQCQEAISEHMKVVLETYDEDVYAWENLVERLRHHKDMSAAQYAKWKSDCRPALLDAAVMIEAKRTPEWSQNPTRKPSVLPSTSKPTLWLLDYPTPRQDGDGISSTESIKFARQVQQWLTGRRRDFLSRHEGLVADVSTISQRLRPEETLYVAAEIGSNLSGNGEDARGAAEDIFNVHVAKKLLDGVGREGLKKVCDVNHDLRKDIREMVLNKWQTSTVEEIRLICLEWKMKERGFWNEVVKVDKTTTSTGTEAQSWNPAHRPRQSSGQLRRK